MEYCCSPLGIHHCERIRGDAPITLPSDALDLQSLCPRLLTFRGPIYVSENTLPVSCTDVLVLDPGELNDTYDCIEGEVWNTFHRVCELWRTKKSSTIAPVQMNIRSRVAHEMFCFISTPLEQWKRLMNVLLPEDTLRNSPTLRAHIRGRRGQVSSSSCILRVKYHCLVMAISWQRKMIEKARKHPTSRAEKSLAYMGGQGTKSER